MWISMNDFPAVGHGIGSGIKRSIVIFCDVSFRNRGGPMRLHVCTIWPSSVSKSLSLGAIVVFPCKERKGLPSSSCQAGGIPSTLLMESAMIRLFWRLTSMDNFFCSCRTSTNSYRWKASVLARESSRGSDWLRNYHRWEAYETEITRCDSFKKNLC